MTLDTGDICCLYRGQSRACNWFWREEPHSIRKSNYANGGRWSPCLSAVRKPVVCWLDWIPGLWL